jgi:hypothetical protein
MMRKIMIALAAVGFAASVAATAADARMGGGGGARGGGFGGGGMRGAMMGGGMRMGMAGGGGMRMGIGGGMRTGIGGGMRTAMVGGGVRSAGFRGGFVGGRTVAFRPGFARPGNRFAFHRFHHRRFAFAAAPLAFGVGYYGGSCWSWQPTPWGWQRIWACDDVYY